MEKHFAWVELIFFDKILPSFQQIVKDIVPLEQLYYSDKVPRISGDVTNKIHFTLFYGLDENAHTNPELNKLIFSEKISELEVNKLVLFEGYQGLYKVLCIEVKDEDKKLFKFSKKIASFSNDETFATREFKPHITLAYVQREYIIPKDYVSKLENIPVKEIKISS